RCLPARSGRSDPMPTVLPPALLRRLSVVSFGIGAPSGSGVWCPASMSVNAHAEQGSYPPSAAFGGRVRSERVEDPLGVLGHPLGVPLGPAVHVPRAEERRRE